MAAWTWSGHVPEGHSFGEETETLFISAPFPNSPVLLLEGHDVAWSR